MDVRAKQQSFYQRSLVTLELRVGGFAPRHLSRSASARFPEHFGNLAKVL
jgi:hypothetical protein